MISSPGEVYAGQKLDYTTDTLPVELPNWFDSPKRMFLSESSQFYLELALMTGGSDSVFSIYNSFRKEKSDFTHLTEFQHIEYEGKVDFE
jgi:asparaginyl-tRNA synthetase